MSLAVPLVSGAWRVSLDCGLHKQAIHSNACCSLSILPAVCEAAPDLSRNLLCVSLHLRACFESADAACCMHRLCVQSCGSRPFSSLTKVLLMQSTRTGPKPGGRQRTGGLQSNARPRVCPGLSQLHWVPWSACTAAAWHSGMLSVYCLAAPKRTS